MKKLLGLLLCVMVVFVIVSPVFAIMDGGCVPYPPAISFRQLKPDVQIKEADNGKGEATILVPFRNEDRSWWEFWKPAYVFKEAKMRTADLPKDALQPNWINNLF